MSEERRDGSAGDGLTEPGTAPIPGEDFVRDGQMFTWFKKGTELRRIKLRNKRVLVGYNGETWYLFFQALVSVKDRQIQTTKIALSSEAAEALHLLMTYFLAPDKFAFLTSEASAAQPPPDPSPSLPPPTQEQP